MLVVRHPGKKNSPVLCGAHERAGPLLIAGYFAISLIVITSIRFFRAL